MICCSTVLSIRIGSHGVREFGNEIIDISHVLTCLFQSALQLAQHRAYRTQAVQAVLLQELQLVVDSLFDPTQRCLRVKTDLKVKVKATAVVQGGGSLLTADTPCAVFRGTPLVKGHIQV